VIRFQEFIDDLGGEDLLAIRGVQARSGVAIRNGECRGCGFATRGARGQGWSGCRRVRASQRIGDLYCARLRVL
jgi:hypothetical protein